MKYLITGGCGFLGSNIGAEILNMGENLIVFDSLYRIGSTQNLEWLKSKGELQFIHGDIRNSNDVDSVIKETKPDIIFHLAGQVAMTTSITNPRMDFEVNALGSFNILEAVRLYSPESGIIYSSTNKVYGDLEQYTYREEETRYICEEYPKGFDEYVPLEFHSPYGSSKGSADQYMLDYARIFNLRTAVFRHSSMYGGRQFATYDQGWIGWFVQKAVEIKNGTLREPFTISGNGKQVRDILHAEDMVNLYLTAGNKIEKIKGQVFNVGGGIDNSLSILELFDLLERKLKITMVYKNIPPRASDQLVFVADLKKANRNIGWNVEVNPEEGIDRMIEWTTKC
ncbi:MAG: GDP-mannose 4,6-dehydratase [Spirochaetales bacterium]|nr:GDP-mannose 4,6-dehydratase [Spirochaetales bacterium]